MGTQKYLTLEKKGFARTEESKSTISATATFSYRSMAKAAFWISFLTIISKICGFGREMAFAAVFGAGAQMDAYLVASLIPTVFFANFFGTLKTTAIPVYTRYLGKDREEACRMARALLGSAGLLSLVSAAAGLVLAPYLVGLLAPGFGGELYGFTVYLSRIMLLAVPFLALASAATPLLHAHSSFLIPAAIGFPYNAALIAAVLIFGGRYGAVAAACGLIVAVAGQFFLQYPALRRGKILSGGGLGVTAALYHPGVREIAALTVPVLIGLMTWEINVVIDRMLASGLSEGSISALNYAARLKDMPQSLIVVSLLTVFYPQLSRLAAEKNMIKFKESLNRATSAIVFLLLPAVVGFLILSRPIVEVVFQRGAFDARAAEFTSIALFYYSFSLLFSSLSALLIRTYYSLGDTKTPLFISLSSVGINIVLNLLLIGPMAHAGLALATSLATAAGFMIRYLMLRRKIGPLGTRRFLNETTKTASAAVFMGLAVYGAFFLLEPLWVTVAFLTRLALLLSLISGGALIYFALSYIFGIREMHYTCNIIKNRLLAFKQRQ